MSMTEAYYQPRTTPGAPMWGEEMVKMLRDLWPEGKSCSEIAKILNGRFHLSLTRSAIIGKAHRLGLARRGASIPRGRPANTNKVRLFRTPVQKAAAVAAARTKPAPALPVVLVPLEPMVQPDGSVCTVLTLSKAVCSWPIGDTRDADFAFCGRARADGGPYCDHHHQRSIQTPEKRVRREQHFARARGISFG